MCRSQAEGGQRCASHTRAALRIKETVLAAAHRTGNRDTITEAHAEWESAAAAYASTDEGAAHFQKAQDAAAAANAFDTEAMLSGVLKRGEALRAASRETGARVAAAQAAGGDFYFSEGEAEARAWASKRGSFRVRRRLAEYRMWLTSGNGDHRPEVQQKALGYMKGLEAHLGVRTEVPGYKSVPLTAVPVPVPA